MNSTLTLRSAQRTSRASRTLLSMLEGLQGGLLEVRLPDHSCQLFGSGDSHYSLHIHDEAVFERVLASGDIGLAEAWLDGQWDTPDLAGLLGLLAANRAQLQPALYGNWRALLLARLRHWLNRNSRAGSRRNIMAHYDLGNDFYRCWLDGGMNYSAALYSAQAPTLELAQHAKHRRILDRLQARPGQQLLEIGCGWGGFARAALQDGLQVTGITLSPAQLEWARRCAPQADLQLLDYRDLQQRFDHIVSIEMFEAVGEQWWPQYFATLARCLRPGGRALIQSIVIHDDLFARYRRGTDFIQQYIFPGGMLPSRQAFRRAAGRAGLQVQDEFCFGLDYARTLADWRLQFEASWPQIAAQGFDERFRRLWLLYLAYCEAGFRSGSLDVVQFELRGA